MKPPHLGVVALAAALLAALPLAAAPATSAAFVVGVGDQSPALFADPHLQRLDPGHVRYIAPYDAAQRGGEPRAALDAWLGAARAAGKEVLVAFNPPAGMRCPNLGRARGCRPVGVGAYRKAFRAFRERYPSIRAFQPWNEVNSLTQPTFHHPEAVAAYYDVVRRACRGCTVLGADLQDLPNAVGYAKRLLHAFSQRGIRAPRLWGLHNYSDTNRFVPDRRSVTRKLVRLLPGRLWLTETGGIYRFQPQNARQTFRPDADRQRRAMEAVFRSAQRYRGTIARVYLYNWYAPAADNRWDSGVLDLAGAPRPAYEVLVRHAARFH